MSITVLLLIALCLLCVVVFLKHKKTERFYEQSCPSIECPYGTSKHIVFSGTPQQKMGCCSNSIYGIGQYFDGNECKDCELELGTENANYLTGKSRTSNYTTTKNSTVASCKAECKTGNWIEHIASTPGTGWFESPTSNAYPTSECDKSVAYSNLYSNEQTYLTIRYDTADSNAPNFEDSWCSNNEKNYNNEYYCCMDSNGVRVNMESATPIFGCCLSNEYLSNDKRCSSCPNGGLCSNDLNQSGILCCQISNCKLSNSPPSTLNTERDAIWAVGNTYYSNNTAVTNISNYGCYAHYQYNKLSDIAADGSNIVSLSNTVYFDGSNYHYLDDDDSTNSNNIINSISISIDSDSNWFYHNDGNSNTLSSKIDIPVREYVDNSLTLKNYSRYYKCDTDKFLRCAQPYDDSATESTESTGCGCCSSNEYFDRTNCKSVDSNTEMIADNQLYLVDLDKCLSGWGKSNFDGNDNSDTLCTKCGNLVYYDSLSNDNTCRPCLSGQYPNSMDDSDNLNTSCSNAPSLTFGQEDWYRFEYIDASANQTNYYLTYTSNDTEYSLFRKNTDTNFRYNNSNIYLWSNDTDTVNIQLPITTYKSGQFLNIDDSSSSYMVSSGHYNPAAVFKPIPYCQPGKYASNLECASCASNEYSSSYGAKNCSNCPLNSTTENVGGKTSSNDCRCPAGYYYNTSLSPPECEECPQNQYCPGGSIGATVINDCPPNTVTDGIGKSTEDECQFCGPGQYFSSYSSTCQPCRDNSSSDPNNKNGCLCNGGWYMYWGDCHPVGRGYYSPNQDNNRQECPDNSSTNTDNASNLNQCLCNGGWYLNNGECQSVGYGYYSPNQDNYRQDCPDDTSTNTTNASTRNQCICNGGLYGQGGGPCQECAFNYRCTGGSQIICDPGQYSLRGSSNCTPCKIKFHYGTGVQYSNDANLSEGNDEHYDWEVTAGRDVCSFYLYKDVGGTGDCDNYTPGQNIRGRPIEGVGGEVTSVKVRSKHDDSVTCTNPDGKECATGMYGPAC